MANGKDIAWWPIGACVAAAFTGIAIGAFLVAPGLQKRKAKKLAKKKKAGEKETMKKAA